MATEIEPLIMPFNPFFTCYPREFWKDNKKRVGEVCEKCRDEIDYSNVREEQK